jgi:hypothetical protein
MPKQNRCLIRGVHVTREIAEDRKWPLRVQEGGVSSVQKTGKIPLFLNIFQSR